MLNIVKFLTALAGFSALFLGVLLLRGKDNLDSSDFLLISLFLFTITNLIKNGD
jgi:hypothetical protein